MALIAEAKKGKASTSNTARSEGACYEFRDTGKCIRPNCKFNHGTQGAKSTKLVCIHHGEGTHDTAQCNMERKRMQDAKVEADRRRPPGQQVHAATTDGGYDFMYPMYTDEVGATASAQDQSIYAM